MKKNYVIYWEGEHVLLGKWGQTDPSKVPTLDVSVLVAMKLDWEKFVEEASTALELADGVGSDYKYIVAGGILLAMNAPKARRITDEFAYEIKKYYEKDQSGKTVLKIGDVPIGQGITIELKENTTKWLVDNGIGIRAGDNVILNDYIVRSMVII